jgi:hypothetical protein
MGGSLINSVAQDGQGAVPAGQLNAYLQTVPNLAALRGFSPQGPMAIQLQGYVSQADGGQGTFCWAASATGPDNGTTVIQPTGVTVGAWVRDDPSAGPITRCITYVADGGGSPLSAPNVVGDLYLPFACTLTGCTLLADEVGNLSADIWLAPFADYPPTVANSIIPEFATLVAQDAAQQDISGWTTVFPAGSTLRFQIEANDTIERLTIALTVTG